MIEVLQYTFIREAIIATFLVGIVCGIVGSFIVVRRNVFISGGIAHATFGGVGLGYLLGLNPMIMAIPFALLCAILIGIISKKTKTNEDTAIGIVWVIGMSVGLIAVSLKPNYQVDVFSYLFGNILMISSADLWTMVTLDIIIVSVYSIFFNYFFITSFDEEYAKISGIPTEVIYFLHLCMVSLSVIVLMKVVGIILTIALLTLPPAIARNFSPSFKKIIVLATIVTILISNLGLMISYKFDLPTGPAITIVGSLLFVLCSKVR